MRGVLSHALYTPHGLVISEQRMVILTRQAPPDILSKQNTSSHLHVSSSCLHSKPNCLNWKDSKTPSADPSAIQCEMLIISLASRLALISVFKLY
jgi:hypothetical protein